MADKKLYAIVEALSEEFGFDPDEAMEVVADQVEEFLASLAPKPKKGGAAKEEAGDGDAPEEDEAVKKTRHNIELWEKKLEKGDYKDKAAHEAKIAKEKTKLEKMLKTSAPAPAKKKEEAPAKKDEKKAVKEEKPAKREKRIKKMSPVISGQLAKALEAEGMQITDEFKKKFQNEYIEGLSDKDYNEQGLADHARNFAKTVKSGGAAPPPSCPLAHLLEAVKKGDQKMPGGGGNLPECNCGKCPSDEKETPEPEAQEDEDLMEVDFKGKTYAVSKISGNVYEEQEGRDVAVGFVGVGKFKGLVLPP